MKLDKIWVVRDPEHVAGLTDIFFKTTLDRLITRYLVGAPDGAWAAEHHVAYTRRAEALADATARLLARDRGTFRARNPEGETARTALYNRIHRHGGKARSGGGGPINEWKPVIIGNHWYVVNKALGEEVKIGRVGEPAGAAIHRAYDEAARRNRGGKRGGKARRAAPDLADAVVKLTR